MNNDVRSLSSGKTAYFSDGVISRSSDKTITENGVVLKDARSVLLPLFWKADTYIFYSDDAFDGVRDIPGCTFAEAKVSRITADGTEFLYETTVTNGQILIKTSAGEALLIEKLG